MAKPHIRRRGRAHPHAARRPVRRPAADGRESRPQAPISETDSEDQAGAYDSDRGESNLPQT